MKLIIAQLISLLLFVEVWETALSRSSQYMHLATLQILLGGLMTLICAIKYHFLGPYVVHNPPENFANLDLCYSCKDKQKM